MSDQNQLAQDLANKLGVPVFTATLEEGITSHYPQPTVASQNVVGATTPLATGDLYGRPKLPARFAHEDEVLVDFGPALIPGVIKGINFTLEDVFYDIQTSNGLYLSNIDSNYVEASDYTNGEVDDDTFAEVLTVQSTTERKGFVDLSLSNAEFGGFGFGDVTNVGVSIPNSLPFEVRAGDKLLVTLVPVVQVEESEPA